jgi:hypothetical protein
LVLLATGCPEAFAERYWKVGFKGGLNISTITGDTDSIPIVTDEITTKATIDGSQTGFIGGVDFTLQFTESIGARLEALYVRKGATGTFSTGTLRSTPIDSMGTTANIILDYFEIPLLGVYSHRLTENMNVVGLAGPTFAISMKSDWELPELSAEGGLDDLFKSVDYGLLLGAGLEYKLGYRSIVLEGRWTYGLSSIDDTDNGLSIKNSSFAFLIGVAISDSPY